MGVKCTYFACASSKIDIHYSMNIRPRLRPYTILIIWLETKRTIDINITTNKKLCNNIILFYKE